MLNDLNYKIKLNCNEEIVVHVNRLKLSKQKPEGRNHKVRLKRLPRTDSSAMNETAVDKADIELSDNDSNDSDTNRLILGGPIQIPEEDFETVRENDYDDDDDTSTDK